LEVVARHFLVFDRASNNQFVDAEGDWLFLCLCFPEEAVHDNFGQDLRCDGVEVGLRVEGLDLEKNIGLGNDGLRYLTRGGFSILGNFGNFG